MTIKTYTEFEAQISEIETAGYELHHKAYRRGYVSRKIAAVVNEYSGKFGRGFEVLTPNRNSTRYCYVAYYTKKEAAQ